jgi:hypothetical protein
MPSAEQIATALLMLKNDPTLRTRIDCPGQRAAMYLKRIVALIGARRVCGDTYFLKAGGKRFLLDNSAVRLISYRGKSTCFSIPTHPYMPKQEVIASALLQLKNNPKLFKRWLSLTRKTGKIPAPQLSRSCTEMPFPILQLVHYRRKTALKAY